MIGLLTAARACNLSDVTLLGITPGPGANFTITMRLCMGYGITGSVKGANGATSGFSFGWYTSVTSPAFSIISYTPTSVSSAGITTPPCTMNSVNISNPPGPAFVGVDVGTFFLMPGGCTNNFLCVTTTANCSNVPSTPLCFNFSFVVNYVPDSMRIFGVEGSGNAVSGCYPNPDMMINFNGNLQGADDPANGASVTTWPNPVVDVLHVDLDWPTTHGGLIISVMDISGRIVHNTSVNALGGSKRIDINLSHLQSGMYVLVAENSRGRAMKKIVVQ